MDGDRTYKDEVRREWTAAATGWRKWIDCTEGEGAGPVITKVLLERANVQPGDRVLDFGSGYGEPGLSAARTVGPAGYVTCVDIARDMLAFAEEGPGQKACPTPRSSKATSKPCNPSRKASTWY